MTVRMDFGKHSGKLLSEIPPGYLRWLLRECDNLDDYLREEVKAELRRRGLHADRQRQQEQQRTYPPPADIAAILERWYRQLCLRHHPDRGGHVEAMKAINHAAELLREMLKEVTR